jgi:hypothetical protein
VGFNPRSTIRSIGLTLPVFVKAEFDAFWNSESSRTSFSDCAATECNQWVLSFSQLQNSRVLKVKSSASLTLSLVDRQPTLSQ